MSWSIEQVLALAPDPASAKAGQGLSKPMADGIAEPDS
jgi:hypothetical protein